MTGATLLEWASAGPSQYVVVINEKHTVAPSFVRSLLGGLRGKNLYLAEPFSYLGEPPADVSQKSADEAYFWGRHVDVYGVAFNVGLLTEFLEEFTGIHRSTIYVNYRLYWGIQKVSPINTTHSYQSQVHVANGHRLEVGATELFGLFAPQSLELRIYVLRYLILYLRGLRSTKITRVALASITDVFQTFNLAELLPQLKTRDRFEMLWLTWIGGLSAGTLQFKRLTGGDAYLRFSTSEPSPEETALYEIDFADQRIWISRFYEQGTESSADKAPDVYDFYSRKISPESVILFFDRPGQADDNAEYLYDYFARSRPEFAHLYFALAPNSPDWGRLKRRGFKLVEMFSERFYELFVLSDAVVASQLYDLEHSGKNLANSRYVYLQHGVQLNDMSDWVISKLFDVFVVTGRPEAEYMEKLAPREVLNAGIPRLQGLQRRNESDSGTGDLLFMPTWRFALSAVSQQGFLESDYFKAINALFQDRQLLDYLETSGRKLKVKLHPNLGRRARLFSFSENVVNSSSSYREAIAEAAFVFTDYSSVLVDAAFIGTPVAYYQWDAENFFVEQPYKSRLNYETEGMGPVFRVHEELTSYISGEAFMKPDAVFDERRRWFFAGVEQDEISERIIERILAL